MIGNKNQSSKKESIWKIISYNFGWFTSNFQGSVFLSLYFFYYETEILLSVWLIFLANNIFAIWNAVNDPIIGYLTDKTTRFTKKWGKRFIWIISSVIPMYFIYILLYSPPRVDPVNNAWILFLWLIIFLCIADLLFSTFHVNFFGMFPDKFRSDDERMRASSIGTALGQLGLVLGMLLPPIFYSFGDRGSYTIMAFIMTGIGLIFVFLMIPGIREDKEMINRYFQANDINKKETFLNTMKFALKQKNFVVYVIIFFVQQVLARLALQSIPYFVKYILGKESNFVVFLNLSFLIGLLGSIVIWMKLAKRLGFGKTFLTAGLLLGLFLIPIIIAFNIITAFIAFFLLGIGAGGFAILILPIFSDVMDEIALKTGKRRQGVYMGIRSFFARFAIIIQTITFALVHTLTGFIPNAPVGTNTQPYSAILGIRMHTALIPMFFVLTGALIFWKFYDITPDQKKSIQEELKKLSI